MVIYKKTDGRPHDLRHVPDDYRLQSDEFRYDGEAETLEAVAIGVRDAEAADPSERPPAPVVPSAAELYAVLKAKGVVEDADIEALRAAKG